MKSNRYIFSVVGAAFLLGATAVQIPAQEPLSGPPAGADTMFVGGGPMGGRMEILGFAEMHPGAVVAGAPYVAMATIESTQTLADGNTINRQTQISIFRDSQGRTRRETTIPAAGMLAATAQPKTFIMIFDPVAQAAYVLHPDTKIADKLPTPPGGGKKHGDFQAKFEARMQQEIANGTLKKEELKPLMVSGVSAEGTRYTHTIAAGQIGNTKDIVVVTERWYSPDLQIVVKSTRNDPRMGQTSYTLTSLQKQEPAATLFAVPADYTVQAAKPHRKGPHGPGGQLPAGADAPPPAPGE